MTIFRKDFFPPQTLVTKHFCLFPTNQNFSESDYVAVMENKEHLRDWSQSSWPEDDFTEAMNREDLGQHVQDNVDHTAYGYMIYSLDKKTCYGSVYVNTLTTIPEHYHTSEDERSLLELYDARIVYWVVQNPSGMERVVTEELREWFKNEWKINVLFTARVELKKRLAIYEWLDMDCKMHLKSKTSKMTLLLF